MLEDAEKQSKISELYDVCMKAEANAVVLPNIVDRLDSLQTLHQQGNKRTPYLFIFVQIQPFSIYNVHGTSHVNSPLTWPLQTYYQTPLSRILPGLVPSLSP